MANSVDPDQTPQNAATDQGLHCLPMPVCTGILDGIYQRDFSKTIVDVCYVKNTMHLYETILF